MVWIIGSTPKYLHESSKNSNLQIFHCTFIVSFCFNKNIFRFWNNLQVSHPKRFYVCKPTHHFIILITIIRARFWIDLYKIHFLKYNFKSLWYVTYRMWLLLIYSWSITFSENRYRYEYTLQYFIKAKFLCFKYFVAF